MDCSPPGFSVHGTFQARILEWVAIFFSRESSPPRDWTCTSYLAGGIVSTEPHGKPLAHGKLKFCFMELSGIYSEYSRIIGVNDANLHTIKKPPITLRLALHIHGSSSVDSLTNCAPAVRYLLGEKKKSTYKWTGAVQTHGPMVHIYLATRTCLVLNKNTTYDCYCG